MAKNFIFAVRKDDNGVITHVKTHMEIKGGYTPDEVRTKFEVIQNITQLHMLYFVSSGEKVHVVDNRYLRTDANDIKEDNLGELPTF